MSETKWTTHHMCVDICGALRRSDSELEALFQGDNGTELEAPFIRASLKYDLAMGKKVLPMQNPPCEGFSYETGCPGHPSEEPGKGGE